MRYTGCHGRRPWLGKPHNSRFARSCFAFEAMACGLGRLVSALKARRKYCVCQCADGVWRVPYAGCALSQPCRNPCGCRRCARVRSVYFAYSLLMVEMGFWARAAACLLVWLCQVKHWHDLRLAYDISSRHKGHSLRSAVGYFPYNPMSELAQESETCELSCTATLGPSPGSCLPRRCDLRAAPRTHWCFGPGLPLHVTFQACMCSCIRYFTSTAAWSGGVWWVRNMPSHAGAWWLVVALRW